jgi:hypothetical protein
LDPIKIVIFIAAFALLLLLGRMLASAGEVHASSLPPPSFPPDESSGAGEESLLPAPTGAEIEFPIKLPPVTRMPDGTYNRPVFLNYYFGKTDLVKGPPDPASFFDEFTLEAEDPETGQQQIFEYTIATPAGLRQVMDQEKFASLYIESKTVIVVRWDLSLILETISEEIMKSYGQKDHSD